MKPLLILYATREGHTRRIVDHIAATTKRSGVTPVCRELKTQKVESDLSSFRAVVLAGPIHAGKHPRELVKLVKTRSQELSQLPTLLVTVCLAQAGVENPDTPADKRAAAERAIQSMADEFMQQTGFRPTRMKTVAGALPYTRYNFFIRWVMKRIVSKEGGDTDTSRDYVYTDWAALARAVEAFLIECKPSNEDNTIPATPLQLAR